MKVVGFNGSPRKEGNTVRLIQEVFHELQKEGIETELVQLSEREIRGCLACYRCIERKNRRCAIETDAGNRYIEKMLGADGILFGSPVYLTDVTSELKALIDRAGYVSRANDRMFRNKVGGAVVAVRRVGAFRTLDTMIHFFLNNLMIVPGYAHAIGKEPGDVEKDEEGMQLVRLLGQRMAWLLTKLHP
jgi:multimeric flavodoxin WrbA